MQLIHLCFNVAQHVLDDISGSQPVTTSEPLTEPFTAPSPEPWVTPGSTPISSADVPNPELTPESVPGETARIHAALSHPYFSNHPTQTSASGVGDIVIDNRPAKKARRLNLSRGKVVGAVVAVVVAVVIIVVAVSGVGKNHTSSTNPIYVDEAVVLVEANIKQVEFLENLFYSSQFDELTTEEIFTDEMQNKINQAISAVIQLQNGLNRFNFTETEESLQQMFIINAQNVLNERASKYANTVDLYNKAFDAYKNGDEEYFNVLSASDNQGESEVGTRFVDFFTTRKYWGEIIAENNCSKNPTTATCTRAQKYYDQSQTSLMTSAPIPRMLFSAFLETPYSQSSLVYNDLELIIEEQTSEE